ncbi:MAG TPA: DUF58 domain-containing protein [Vicinamibacterales bacterium]|nr:DUF58 domain-containing protein [Vicinamibacterales bacterium]
MAGPARYLDPAIVARLGTIDLKAKTIVEGFLTGLHRSPFKGFSVEFAEYRQYLPGDDLATLDWKIYARTDRHVVKKFEEETNLECHIMLDVSRSMGYGSHAVTKLEYASYLAGALAYLMNRQRDAVGLLTFDDHIRDLLPSSARPGHLKSVLLTLERLTLGTRTDIAKPLGDLVQAIRKRGLVVLISDLLDEPDRIIEGLKHFRYRGTDVVVFQVLDPDELSFPFERAARFRDLESDREVVAVPAAVRDAYKARLDAMVSNFRTVLGQNGIDYTLLDTSQPLELALLPYLQTRRRTL